MNLDLNDDQQLLFDTVHAAVGRGYTTGGRAAATSSELGWNQRVWATLAELGLTGLTIAVAHAEPSRAWDVAPAVTVTLHDDGSATISGVKSPVLHADQAQSLLVTVVDESGRGHVVVVDASATGITRTDGRTSDWTHASQVEFTDTPAALLGDTPAEADVLDALRSAFAQARIAVTGEAIGLMESGLTQTVEYLKSRKQFGVPLSSFQALVLRAPSALLNISDPDAVGRIPLAATV